jgi:hypothetical protein
LPESWHHDISGEFTSSDGQLSLRLRVNGEIVFSATTAASDSIDDLLGKGAVALVG